MLWSWPALAVSLLLGWRDSVPWPMGRMGCCALIDGAYGSVDVMLPVRLLACFRLAWSC